MAIPKELRILTATQLEAQLKDAQNELQRLYQLRHSKQVQPEEIREVKKDIARIKTIQYEKQLAELCAEFKGKKFIPKKLRFKGTRALRRSLTPKQRNLKSKNQRILNKKYPQQIYTFIDQ